MYSKKRPRELTLGDYMTMPSKMAKKGRSVAKRSVYVSRDELKGMDTPLTQAVVLASTGTNGGIFPVNLVDPGTGSFNRIGRKIDLKSIQIRLRAEYTNAQTGGFCRGGVLRMSVVWDQQPAGVIPNFDLIFGRTVQNGTESSEVFDGQRYDNTGRFRILRDKYYKVNPMAALDVQTLVSEVKDDIYITLAGKQTLFNSNSTPVTIADIANGALYVIFRSDSNNAGVETWSITTSSLARLRYKG